MTGTTTNIKNSGIGVTLKPNLEWAKLPIFNRKGWKRLPFGAFADSINERVEPVNAAEEIYVGLDDLDPGSLHIRRWGKGSDVIGTKLRFRKGDIIFGRRRAYQRKLAVAEFDGICSAHAMVVRTKPNMVLPKFLPFLMMSDKFMNRAVEISVGSLSPTINWTTLKLEEFALPPLDQQRRIAQILWAVDGSIGSTLALLTSLEVAHDAEFQKGEANGAASQRIENFTSLISDGDHNPPKRTSTGVPHVLVQNIRDGKVDFSNCTLISKTDFEWVKKRYVPQKNDILIVCVGATIGRAGIVRGFVEFSTDRSLAVIRFDPDKVLPGYGFALVTSRNFQTQIHRNSVGTAQPHLFLGDIRRIKVAIPPISEQYRVIEVLEKLGSARKAATRNLSNLRTLREQLSLAILESAHV
jgi:restriction endonuclease S subunit